MLKGEAIIADEEEDDVQQLNNKKRRGGLRSLTKPGVRKKLRVNEMPETDEPRPEPQRNVDKRKPLDDSIHIPRPSNDVVTTSGDESLGISSDGESLADSVGDVDADQVLTTSTSHLDQDLPDFDSIDLNMTSRK